MSKKDIDRKEYIDTRNEYIKWSKEASLTLQRIIFLVSTWWFIYTESFIKESTGCSCVILLTSWGLFAFALICSILTFYLSWKSHEMQLDIYDKEYKNSKNKDLFNEKNKLSKINFWVDFAEFAWMIWIILWIILLFISYSF